MHFIGEKGEIQWCTLIMATDQKLLDLAGSLLQTIAKTQENLGEMLKLEKRAEWDKPTYFVRLYCLQKELKILLGEIREEKESGSMMGHPSNRSIKKRSRHEDSKEIEHVKKKQPVKCWRWGGHHCCRNCPTIEHQEGSSHKVPRLGNEPKAKNQQQNLVEAKGLGPESSK